jgi:hypothetical protein
MVEQNDITKDELMVMGYRALCRSAEVKAPLWKEAYMSVAVSCKNLENMLVRCEEVEKENKNGIKLQQCEIEFLGNDELPHHCCRVVGHEGVHQVICHEEDSIRVVDEKPLKTSP